MMILAKNSSSLFWGMVSLLVFAMFSYPFDLLPYKVITVLIVAWSESVGGKRMLEIGRIKALLLGAFLGFVSWQTGTIVNESWKIDNYSGIAMSFGDYYSISFRNKNLSIETRFIFSDYIKLKNVILEIIKNLNLLM